MALAFSTSRLALLRPISVSKRTRSGFCRDRSIRTSKGGGGFRIGDGHVADQIKLYSLPRKVCDIKAFAGSLHARRTLAARLDLLREAVGDLGGIKTSVNTASCHVLHVDLGFRIGPVSC